MKFKILKSKRLVSVFSALCVLTTGTVVASISTVVAHVKTKENAYYKFDGQVFKSNTELIQYANNKAQKESYQIENDYYLYNNKAYDLSQHNVLENDIASQFPIQAFETYRNPAEYVINSAGEISNQVLTTQNDKLTTVYRGKDGNAYLDINEAIATHQSYQKVYKLGSINNSPNGDNGTVEFANRYGAIQYLENIVQQNLKDNNTTKCYTMAGTCLTKDQVSDWIRSTTDIQYDYNGFRWSNRNLPDISKLKLIQRDEEKNIQLYKPFKKSYWLNIDSIGLIGSFSGTQYIESDDSQDVFQNKLMNGWKKLIQIVLMQF
ncbi:hypothetical protein SSYRP_v1c08320 [Spiroplasma syrphidicola EA-1]|uniref:Uncharacterized protein n=1 Tax=Spiroplasma syrphidicola EA-1 TaxID=1276229 RepID=R4UMF7_9MOLU|nr:hypothetical protein [Spiroplasma syrphidicola]AGM26421.1 hypothetical protein SSYRP_v1c08320 [Spiroplasma syrphidicola EA-1]